MVRELAYGPANKHEHVPLNMASGIQKAFDMYWNRHCMGIRNTDENNPLLYTDSYSWLTYKTVGDRVKNFGHGLRNLIEPRGYLGICAANRPEWMITDFACILQSIISVPIYCLFNDREVAYVINNTQVSVIVCDKHMLPKFIRLRAECPSLRHIVCMDPIDVILDEMHEKGPSLHYIGDIEKSGSMQKYDQVIMKPTDHMTIIYTSGSSGFPKGAIISEGAYRATFQNWFRSCLLERITFCYRPLAWAADRDTVTRTFLDGGRIGFSTGDVSRLMEELAIVRPTHFSAPPSIWNKIYAEYKTALSLVNAQNSSEIRAAEKQRLLREFSKLIPASCKRLTVGSAKISPTVLKFMKQCFSNCRIFDSYGITECGGVAYNNILENTMQYRLESVPEMGYTVDDKPFPRGEILAKTVQMFSGYINNPEETRAALTKDGFFRTGDIVELRTNKYGQLDLHVIDRKKSFFKLSHGQFVSPEFLQSIYIRSPFVEQIYIHGDLLADSVAAVVVPNRAYAQAFVRKHNLENFDMNNPDPQFCNAVLQDLRSLAKKESLRVHEIPAQLVIDFEPFTPENGLLTASFKPCRHKLAAYYADRLKVSKTIDQRLKSIIETVTGQSVSNNEEEHSLIANGGDSLTAVRLSSMIEKDFGIPIPIGVLFEPTMTLQQLTTLIKDPSQISTMSRSIVPQLWNDCQLNMNIKMNECKTTFHSPSVVFITGTTGFVGAFLLAELLTVYPSNCKFVCLVRCESSMNPLDRIQNNMLFYQIWKENYEERIIPLRGDLAKSSFGLDNETYESLANQIDIIFHCGAAVNFVLPYSKLYGPNVCGTREIIRLATYTSNYIPVQYISTVSVLSNAINEEISIEKIPPDDLVSGYAQSKWVAEKLITKASQLGLPVVIYRLGSISATTESGSCNKNDIHTLLLAAIIKLGCYSETALHCHFDGLPVDFTAKSIVYLSSIQPDVYGKIYHVANPTNRVAFEDIIDGIHHCGIQLEKVSYEEWRVKLKTITDRDGPFESVGEFLLDGALHEGSTLSATQFCNAVSSLNFPSLDKDYVFKWLSFILHQIVR
jgi:fatty acid CoA ligase FadD9